MLHCFMWLPASFPFVHVMMHSCMDVSISRPIDLPSYPSRRVPPRPGPCCGFTAACKTLKTPPRADRCPFYPASTPSTPAAFESGWPCAIHALPICSPSSTRNKAVEVLEPRFNHLTECYDVFAKRGRLEWYSVCYSEGGGCCLSRIRVLVLRATLQLGVPGTRMS